MRLSECEFLSFDIDIHENQFAFGIDVCKPAPAVQPLRRVSSVRRYLSSHSRRRKGSHVKFVPSGFIRNERDPMTVWRNSSRYLVCRGGQEWVGFFVAVQGLDPQVHSQRGLRSENNHLTIWRPTDRDERTLC